MAVTERVLPAAVPGAGGRIIATPFQFLSTGEDDLLIEAWNSITGVVVGVDGRWIQDGRNIDAFAHRLICASDRTRTAIAVKLGVGYVLNLTVYAASGAPRMGQTFVRVSLIRGLGAAAIVLGTLLQGYVTAVQGLGWPGSPIVGSFDVEPPPRLITGTTPAVGSQIDETVPTGARWKLAYFQAILTTDATVITRGPRLAFNSHSASPIYCPSSGSSLASTLKYYGWFHAAALDSDHTTFISTGPLPPEAVLLAGQQIATNTENMQAGDKWTVVGYAVQEWLEVDA